MTIQVGDGFPDVPITIATPTARSRRRRANISAAGRSLCSPFRAPSLRPARRGTCRPMSTRPGSSRQGHRRDRLRLGQRSVRHGRLGRARRLGRHHHARRRQRPVRRAVGLAMDGAKFGMGKRSQRYSMVVNDGVVEQLNVEGPGEYRASSAEHMLEQLVAAFGVARRWKASPHRSAETTRRGRALVNRANSNQ
jgi:glutaredoxin/glutathione-dependent peroxiredoxin